MTSSGVAQPRCRRAVVDGSDLQELDRPTRPLSHTVSWMMVWRLSVPHVTGGEWRSPLSAGGRADSPGTSNRLPVCAEATIISAIKKIRYRSGTSVPQKRLPGVSVSRPAMLVRTRLATRPRRLSGSRARPIAANCINPVRTALHVPTPRCLVAGAARAARSSQKRN